MKTLTTIICIGIAFALWCCCKVGGDADREDGYDDEVIMAAGTFVSGASVEISADGPMRPPFTAFLQGGLTYESARLGILSAADKVAGR